MGVGDMSLRHGGYMTSHSWHRNGTEVDVRYVRKDKSEWGEWAGALDLNNEPAEFDTTATIDLINTFIAQGNVQLISISDLTGISISDVSDTSVINIDNSGVHDNHFHVQIVKP